MDILNFIVENYDINWKAHYDAPVPSFNEEAINIYEFNHDKYDPLRDKDSNIYVQDDYIMLYWLCQEAWRTNLSGMKKEITRWAKYWINQYHDNTELEEVRIKVKVEDRDGYKHDSFIIKITVNKKD